MFGARIYKYDNTCNQPLGYIDVVDIEKISLVKEKPNGFVFFVGGDHAKSSVKFFSTNDVKAVIEAVQKTRKDILKLGPLEVCESSLNQIKDLREMKVLSTQAR